MKLTIDARGAACPQPVIETKKALEASDIVTTIVDNTAALENLRRLAGNLNCSVSDEKKTDGIYVTITKTALTPEKSIAEQVMPPAARNADPTVLAVSQDVMGKGDDALGQILIRGFFHTLADGGPAPDIIVFFNSGVRLLAAGSDVIEDIRALEEKNIKILACGTCLDYYKIMDARAAGTVTNMYEIKELLLAARSVINL